jgi:hypothetical protein
MDDAADHQMSLDAPEETASLAGDSSAVAIEMPATVVDALAKLTRLLAQQAVARLLAGSDS